MTQQRRPGRNPGNSEPAPIQASTITVRTGRLVCDIQIANPRFRYSNPELAARIVARYPSIVAHSCVNDADAPLREVLDSTSVPHLLEHIVIDVQTRSSANPDAVFVGTTEWLDEGEGLARVEVSFADDLEALRALREALGVLNEAVIL